MEPELAEIRDFLAAHPPFSELPEDVLNSLPGRCAVRYHRRGTVVVRPEDEVSALTVVRSGALDVHDPQGSLVERVDVGGTVGVTGLLEAPPYGFVVTAVEDTLVLLVPEAAFRDLLAHPSVASHFLLQQAHRLRRAVERVQTPEGGDAVLRTRVQDLLRGEGPDVVVSVPPRATVQEAARLMRERRVSSVLVLDEQTRLRGIVTDRDLRNRVVAEGLAASLPVEDVMTSAPITIDADALVLEALLEMLGRGVHHLPVVEDGRVVGLVTSTDLLRLERQNPLYIVQDVSRRTDAAGLAQVTAQLPGLVGHLVTQDASAADVSRVVSAVADAVHRRLLTLGQEALGPPPVPYCWVVLGSQARHESGLGGDQDTALILDDSATAEHDAYFARLAAFVTDGLQECGFPRCPGDVMAVNPRWRATLSQWQAMFTTWLTEPTPDAVLSSTIFFDMRFVGGRSALADELRAHVMARTPHARSFLAHLVKQAVSNPPPLGLFRSFVLERGGGQRDVLDLKHRGTGPVVDIARAHALAIGASAVDTRSRIEAARLGGRVSDGTAADLTDAFEFISHVRLRHQSARVAAGDPPDNFVPPASLGSFEKRTLKDAFGVVQSAQSVLAQGQPLGYIS